MFVCIKNGRVVTRKQQTTTTHFEWLAKYLLVVVLHLTIVSELAKGKLERPQSDFSKFVYPTAVDPTLEAAVAE